MSILEKVTFFVDCNSKLVFQFLQLCGLCMLLIFLNTCAWVAEKKVYGEECLDSRDCNEKELLSCGSNGRCNCSPSHSLLYDKDLDRCVARVGEKCGAAFRGDLAFAVLCVDGAICDESSGGCVCTDDNFRVINGTCLRKRKYMEICHYNSECSKDLGNSKPLICLNGFCVCDPKSQFYDEKRKQCVTRIGGECNSELARYRNECPTHGYCLDGFCTCQEEHARTSSGQCALGHGAQCQGANECSDLFYQCLDGKCQCKFPVHQLFDNRSQECLSLVGGPCSLNLAKLEDSTTSGSTETADSIIHQRCTKNAVCTDLGFYSSCECLDNFVQRIPTGECAPGYGENCEANDCDPITPLYCRNGRCDCQDELQYYDPSRRRCLGMVGTRCNPLEVNQCVQFASCIQVGSELEGRCFCDRYAEEINNRTCIYIET